MKQFSLFFYILLLVAMLSSCQKEELHEQPKTVWVTNDCGVFEINLAEAARAGGDTILYLTALTMDNAVSGDSVRTHQLFDQSDILYIKFIEDTSLPSFGIGGGVIAKNYNSTWVLNDSIFVRQIHVAGATASNFTHVPNLSNNTLVNNHPAFEVTLKLRNGIRTLNFYRNQKINLARIDVLYDGLLQIQDEYYPWSKNTNVFNPGHRI